MDSILYYLDSLEFQPIFSILKAEIKFHAFSNFIDLVMTKSQRQYFMRRAESGLNVYSNIYLIN